MLQACKFGLTPDRAVPDHAIARARTAWWRGGLNRSYSPATSLFCTASQAAALNGGTSYQLSPSTRPPDLDLGSVEDGRPLAAKDERSVPRI